MNEQYQRELERRAAAAKPMKSTAEIIAEMMRNGELDFLETTEKRETPKNPPRVKSGSR